MNFADCIGKSITEAIPSNDTYTQTIFFNAGYSFNANKLYSFADTGGEYVRVRVKLSEISSYFNNDGSHTAEAYNQRHNFKFKYEEVGGNQYDSLLYIHSGGVITCVTPDSDGCVEFYISTNIGEGACFWCSYDYAIKTESGFVTKGSPKGEMDQSLWTLTFGNIDLNYGINVNDVTALQQYLSGTLELDSLQYFYADTNRDGVRDVRDVTTLQKAIAK